MAMLRILLSRALANIRSRPGLNLSSAAVIAVGLVLLGSFWIAVSNMRSLAGGWIEQVDLICFMRDDADPDMVLGLYDEVSSWPEVKSVDYVTKQQALDDLRRRLGDYVTFLDDLDENPLSDLLEIETGDLEPELIAQLEQRLYQRPIVDEVYRGGDWIGRLERVLGWITAAGTIVGLFLALAVALIGANTIKLTLSARRDEIEIALLVGATRAFVLVPFYIEGALLGLIGGVVAAATLLPLSSWVVIRIGLQPSFWLGGAQLEALGAGRGALIVAAGVALGLLGALISLVRAERFLPRR
ncbi:MAG: ABC transporter permease [Candidatus Alcyoniella australis]|nr:ABC transporter permease [Candidatus Alcyoniella australis]